MATTTESALRTLTASLVAAVVPTRMTDKRFIESTYDQEFTDWCEANPDACLRRYSVRDTLQYQPPQVTNTDVELRVVTLEVMVGYPNTFRYNTAKGRAQDDVISSDMHKLEQAIGLNGYGNYSTVAALRVEGFVSETVDGNGVTFIRFLLPYQFERVMT
jgi:hypothetical protein